MARIATWARRTALLGLAAGLLLLPHQPAEASGIGTTRLTVDFTKPHEAARQARWDDMDIIRCGAKGLGWGETKDANTSRESTLFTTEPMGIGSSWRPTRNADIRVKLTWTGAQAEKAIGHLYVRYGCDGEHWSQWRDVPAVRTDKPLATKEYRTHIRVPRATRLRYDAWLRKYAETDVPWKSDEEAAVTALMERSYGDYFEHYRPFVGYLQFMYETEFRGGTHLESLQAGVTWVLPGAHYPPEDKQARQGRDGPWRWKTDLSHEDEDEKPAFDHKAETKAVHEAVLRYALARSRSARPVKQLVLMARSRTIGLRSSRWLRNYKRLLPGMSEFIWQSLADATHGTWVASDLDVGVPVVFLSYWRWRRISLAPNEWAHFYKRWPDSGGRFYVTGVGFDKTDGGDPMALVEVGHMYGDLAGYGTLYLLTKKLGRWSVTASVGTWVS